MVSKKTKSYENQMQRNIVETRGYQIWRRSLERQVMVRSKSTFGLSLDLGSVSVFCFKFIPQNIVNGNIVTIGSI